MPHYWFKLLIISFLLISESESCVKRFKEIKRKLLAKFGHAPYEPQVQQQQRPAILDQDTFPKYAKNRVSDFFIELEEDENGSYRVINLERLPPILSQTLNKNETLNITLTFGIDNVTAEAQIAKLQNDTNSLGFESLSENSEEGNDLLFLADSPSTTATPELEDSTTSTSSTTAAPNGEEEEVPLSEEDVHVRDEWGGECTKDQWEKCNKITRLLAPYNLVNLTKLDPYKVRWMDIDCFVEPILCLCNGWTVNRCHVMCMSRCNKEMLVNWDKLVILEGVCPLSVITEGILCDTIAREARDMRIALRYYGIIGFRPNQIC